MKKYIVHKIYWNYEKEERWLNEMASKGLHFIDYTFCRYLFVKGAPAEYVYRIELLPNLVAHPESQSYIEFMESVGVEYMGKWWRWVFFRKKASLGPFEIFSDYDSKIRHYKRVSALMGSLGALNLFAFLLNVANGIISASVRNNSHIFNFFTYISPLVLLNGIIAVCLTWLVISFMKKVKRLKKEKQLHE